MKSTQYLLTTSCSLSLIPVTKFRHQQHDLMSFEFPDNMSKRKKNHAAKKHNNNNNSNNGDHHQHDSLNPLMYLDVSKALLHITLHNDHVNAALLDELHGHLVRQSPFRVTVHRLIAKDHQNPASEKFSKEELSVEVPQHLIESLLATRNGSGAEKGGGEGKGVHRMIQLDISQMVKDWYKYPKKNHGLLLTTEPARLRNLISMKQTDQVSRPLSIHVSVSVSLFFLSYKN